MAEEQKRPALRIVKPHEEVPPEVLPELPKKESTEPIPEPPRLTTSVSYEKALEGIDPHVPLVAAFLACVSARVADLAVSFYHHATQHAPKGTFRKDVPPGLKSAEATRAWIGTHLLELKKPKIIKTYERGNDLREAARVAGAELDRALSLTRVAGLWFEDRCSKIFEDAIVDINCVSSFITGNPVLEIEIVVENVYLMGCDVLGAEW